VLKGRRYLLEDLADVRIDGERDEDRIAREAGDNEQRLWEATMRKSTNEAKGPESREGYKVFKLDVRAKAHLILSCHANCERNIQDP